MLRRKCTQQGKFAGKHARTDDLGEFLCIGTWWSAPAGNTEQLEALLLGLDSGTAPDGAYGERRQGDGNVDTGRNRINCCQAGAAVDGMGSVLPAGDEHCRNDVCRMGVEPH